MYDKKKSKSWSKENANIWEQESIKYVKEVVKNQTVKERKEK